VPVSGWSWCHACGHRAAGQEVPVERKAFNRRLTPRSEPDFVLAARLMPFWGWVLVGGLLMVASFTLGADLHLPPGGRPRAVWSVAQFFLGLGAFLVAGVTVSVWLWAHGERVTLIDLLLPNLLWALAFQRLPHTRWHICAAAWSLAAALCGVAWIGGWTYWLAGHSPPAAGEVEIPRLVRPVPKPDKASGDDLSPQMFPIGTGAGADQAAGGAPGASGEPVKRMVDKYAIVGYTLKEGELDGLLVARVAVAEGKREFRYAGVVPAGKDPAVREGLLQRFAALKAEAPLFPDLDVNAQWLRPKLICEVESTLSDQPVLKDPEFKGLVFPRQPEPVIVPVEGEAAPGSGPDSLAPRGAGEKKAAPEQGGPRAPTPPKEGKSGAGNLR
jgi:hypothetical protein